MVLLTANSGFITLKMAENGLVVMTSGSKLLADSSKVYLIFGNGAVALLDGTIEAKGALGGNISFSSNAGSVTVVGRGALKANAIAFTTSVDAGEHVDVHQKIIEGTVSSRAVKDISIAATGSMLQVGNTGIATTGGRILLQGKDGISLPALLQRNPILREMRFSKGGDNVIDKILKSAACIWAVTQSHGPYGAK